MLDRILRFIGPAVHLTLIISAANAKTPFIECTKDNRSLGKVLIRYAPKSLDVGGKIKVERQIHESGQKPTEWVEDTDQVVTSTGLGYFTTKELIPNEFTGASEEFLFVTRMDGLGREDWARYENWGVLHNSGWSICEIKFKD